MAKERQAQHMHTLAEVVVLHTSQTFTLYGKRPLHKSVKDKLAFVQYRKGRREGSQHVYASLTLHHHLQRLMCSCSIEYVVITIIMIEALPR